MTKLTIDNIKSNNIKRCIDCGIPITYANDSKWEAFTEDGKSQPMCAICEIKRHDITEKTDDKT